MAHRLAEGQQDLAAQHVEVAGRRGAVDHYPVAVIELSHLEVLGERLEEQGAAGRWPACGIHTLALLGTAAAVCTPVLGEGGQHSRGRRPSHHCSSAGTSRAWLRSAPGPGSKCQIAQPGQRSGGTGDLSHRMGTLGLGESLKGFMEEMPSLRSLNHRKAPGMWDKSREVASDEGPATATKCEHVGQKEKAKRPRCSFSRTF